MKHLLTVVVALVAVACSSYVPEAPPGTPERRAQLELVLQVCVPSGQKLPSAKNVKRFGSSGELGSSGTWPLLQVGTTSAGQSVFEPTSSIRQAAFVALVITDKVRYLFLPPAHIEREWGDWMSPSSQHSLDDAVDHKLARGETIDFKKSDGVVPKVRYRIVPPADYLSPQIRRNANIADSLPPPC